jgi:hypothetical protein
VTFEIFVGPESGFARACVRSRQHRIRVSAVSFTLVALWTSTHRARGMTRNAFFNIEIVMLVEPADFVTKAFRRRTFSITRAAELFDTFAVPTAVGNGVAIALLALSILVAFFTVLPAWLAFPIVSPGPRYAFTGSPSIAGNCD